MGDGLLVFLYMGLNVRVLNRAVSCAHPFTDPVTSFSRSIYLSTPHLPLSPFDIPSLHHRPTPAMDTQKESPLAHPRPARLWKRERHFEPISGGSSISSGDEPSKMARWVQGFRGSPSPSPPSSRESLADEKMSSGGSSAGVPDAEGEVAEPFPEGIKLALIVFALCMSILVMSLGKLTRLSSLTYTSLPPPFSHLSVITSLSIPLPFSCSPLPSTTHISARLSLTRPLFSHPPSIPLLTPLFLSLTRPFLFLLLAYYTFSLAFLRSLTHASLFSLTPPLSYSSLVPYLAYRSFLPLLPSPFSHLFLVLVLMHFLPPLTHTSLFLTHPPLFFH